MAFEASFWPFSTRNCVWNHSFPFPIAVFEHQHFWVFLIFRNFDPYSQKVSFCFKIRSSKQVEQSFEHQKSCPKIAQNAVFWPICAYTRLSKAIKGNVCGVLCKRRPKIATNRQNSFKWSNFIQITSQFMLFWS